MTRPLLVSSQSLVTKRLTLRLADPRYAKAVHGYSLSNQAHLAPWEPLRIESFYTLSAIAERLEAMKQQMNVGTALNFLIFSQDDDQLIGDCNFTNIVRGPFQACHLGFSIAKSHQGFGLMRECLTGAIEYVFCELRLHRIMANYRPENERSARLLSVLGFEREGFAKSYLKINGVWADHVLTSLVNQTAD